MHLSLPIDRPKVLTLQVTPHSHLTALGGGPQALPHELASRTQAGSSPSQARPGVGAPYCDV